MGKNGVSCFFDSWCITLTTNYHAQQKKVKKIHHLHKLAHLGLELPSLVSLTSQ